MKSTLIKIVFAALVCTSFTYYAKADTDDDNGSGFVCPQGDKYKCAEKNGWVIYKGDGGTVVN